MMDEIILSPTKARCFLERLKGDVFIKIYNLGSNNFYEYPIFIYSNKFVYRIFLSFESISIQTYEIHFFENNIQDGIFQATLNPLEFDYLLPNPEIVDSLVVDVKVLSLSEKFKEIRFTFENHKTLCVRCSDLVPGTMDSWLE